MKKLIKIVLGLAGLVVVLLLVTSLALKLLLPPEKAKTLVVEKLSAQLHRQVEVGAVSVGVVSGLHMTGLKISEKPTFAQGTFLSSDEFQLKVALLPLLSKSVVIRSVFLKKPDVTIIRLADGKTFNFSDLTETAAPVPPAKGNAPAASGSSEPASSLTLLVSRAEVQQGALKFVDRSPAKQSIDIRPFDLKLQNVSLTKPFQLSMATKAKYQGNEIAVSFGGDADLLAGVFNIKTGEIATGQAKLALHGQLANLKSGSPTLKLHAESNAMPVQDLLRWAPGALPPDLSVAGTTTLAADLSGNANAQEFAAKWSGTGLKITQGQDFVKPEGTPLDLSVIGSRAANGVVALKTISGSLAGNPLTGNGIYNAAGKAPQISMRLMGSAWSLESLAKLVPALASSNPKGQLSFDAVVSGLASAPQTVVQTKAKLEIPVLKHAYYQGQSVAMQWDLSGITPDLTKVTGTAALTQGPGQILELDKLAKSSRIGQIALAPIQILAKLQAKGVLSRVQLPNMQKLSFDALAGDYVIKAGKMDIRKFDLSGKDLSILNKGQVGLFGAQTLSLNVALKLAQDAIGGDLGSLIKDESGRPTVKMMVTGTADSPQVKWDLQDASQKALQKAGDELMKNPEIKGAVEDIQKSLKGIFR